jgi:CheY-like chemotaxis protein
MFNGGEMPTPGTLLVVEDDDQLLRLLCRMAQAAGLSTIAVYDGAKVLSVAREHHPDIIVLDVGLAGADGRDVLKSLKTDPRTSHIPVFVHTGRSDHSDRLAAFALGADDYFEKPFDLGMLIRRILHQLEKLRVAEDPTVESEIDRLQADLFRSDRQERLSSGKFRIGARSTRAPILVVEDDNDIRQSICEILEDEGLATWNARNGKEALELLHKQSSTPSLILLDLQMPTMDGFEFHERLSREPAISPTPVVLMSAGGPDPRLSSLPWLKKPMSLADLLSAVSKVA